MDKRKNEEKNEEKKEKPIIVKTDTNNIGKMIGMEDEPLVKHLDPVIPDGYGVWILIAGTTGTGKTYLLRALIPMFKKPSYIILATKLHDVEVHSKIRQYCKQEKIKFYKCYDDEGYWEVIKMVREDQKNDKTKDMLIIFDDFSNYKEGRNDKLTNCQIQTFSMMRNYRACGISITQQYQNFDTFLRCNAKLKILFPVEDVHGIDCYKRDIRNVFASVPKDIIMPKIDKWLDYINSHQFTFLCLCGKPNPRMMLGFKKTLFELPKAKEGGDIDDVDENTQKTTEEMKKYDVRGRLKTSLAKGMIERNKLLHQAFDLGLPTYRHEITNAQLKQYIELKSAQGEKSAGNDSPEVKKIIEGAGVHTQKTLYHYFMHIIRKMSRGEHTEKDKAKFSKTVDEMIDAGYLTKDRLNFYLHKYDIEDMIKLV